MRGETNRVEENLRCGGGGGPVREETNRVEKN